MPSEDPDESRPVVLRAVEELYAPTYPDLASAPNSDGILVEVDGSGADPAGYYNYSDGAWSGPWGGVSNLPDSVIDETTTVANTETYSFGEYLSGSEDANDAKRVNLDVDTTNLDTRYLKNYEDDFELSDPTDPTVDQPSTPGGFRFEAGSASAAVPGGYYYTDTPDGITSMRSFGCGFESATAPDGSTIQSSTWALAQEFAVGAGGHDLTVSTYARPTADYASYDDGNTHADTETFVGADDAFVEIRCYDASLQPLALDTTTQYSGTASEQHFAAGNTSSLSGSTWVTLEHTATLPADTAYVEVRLQTADAGDMWTTRGDTGTGHAAILFDDFQARYTAGLRRSGVLGHDHDTRYLNDSAGTVAESNLGFDTATQAELDSHAGTAGAHHSRYGDSEAVSAVEASSPLNADITGNAATADNAANAQEIGQNGLVEVRSALAMNGETIGGLGTPNHPEDAISQGWAESRYINESDEASLSVAQADTASGLSGDGVHEQIALSHPNTSEVYTLQPDEERVVANWYNLGQFHLWGWGVRPKEGGVSGSGLRVFLYDDSSGSIVKRLDETVWATGSPIYSASDTPLRLHIKNVGSSGREASAIWAWSRG